MCPVTCLFVTVEEAAPVAASSSPTEKNMSGKFLYYASYDPYQTYPHPQIEGWNDQDKVALSVSILGWVIVCLFQDQVTSIPALTQTLPIP